jgi:hypothetical protein
VSTSVESIGGYRIERELGEGTLLATKSNGRRVVLKMLEGDCLLKGQLHPMIKDRLGRVRELAHLGVANLQGAEREGEKAFLVWGFVEGISLEEFLREYEPERERLEQIASQIVVHVEALHGLGIVHGAIHGRNVIVRPDGGVMLTHVSPLLYHEEGVDVEAVKDLLGEMEFEASHQSSLKELMGVIRPENQVDEGDAAPEGEYLRRWALIGAIVAAIVGASVAWVLWRNAASQPAREAARATGYSCACHPIHGTPTSGGIL